MLREQSAALICQIEYKFAVADPQICTTPVYSAANSGFIATEPAVGKYYGSSIFGAYPTAMTEIGVDAISVEGVIFFLNPLA